MRLVSSRFGLLAISAAIAWGTDLRAANLVADYDFQGANPLSSSVSGAPNLTSVGNAPTFASETVDGQSRTVAVLGGTGGLRGETDAIIPNNGIYSIVLLARYNVTNSPLDTTFAAAGKVIDFKDRASDAGVYNGQGVFQFFDGVSTNVAIGTSPAGSLTAGNYIQFVITRDASNAVNAYVAGAPAFSFTDTLGNAQIGAAMAQQFLNYLIDDTVTPGVPIVNENQGGAIARIRLYSDVLTPTQVAALDLVPEPTSLASCVIGAMLLARRFRFAAK